MDFASKLTKKCWDTDASLDLATQTATNRGYRPNKSASQSLSSGFVRRHSCLRVPRVGIEPTTPAFSVLCSTN
jgi:hypothetical protein